MENNKNEINEIPMLMSAKDIQKMGISRAMAYCILNRDDIPIVKIGDRKMVKREDFLKWLDEQIVNNREDNANEMDKGREDQ